MEQILQLNPSTELRFKGPFAEVVPSKLELTNPSDQSVSFKVKTTAPRRYCVRPNSGVIKPSETVSVMLMLQPFDFDPKEKNKHKFMVQALYTPDSDMSIDELFKQAKPDQLMETKLRCMFEMPEDASAPAAPGEGAPPAYTLQPSAQASPAQTSAPQPAQSAESATAQQVPARKLEECLEEVKKLRAECSALRQENMVLKEERLSATRGPAPPMPATLTQDTSLTQTHAMLAALMVILGWLLAKFVL